MSVSHEGQDQKKQSSALDSLLTELDGIVGQAHRNSESYRVVLRNLDEQTLSWEEPQDKPEQPDVPEVNNHIRTLYRLIEDLKHTEHKNSEMLEHFHKLI